MRSTSRRAAIVAALVLGWFAPAAQAAFPGGNGRLAFVRGEDVWTAAADGSDQRVLVPGAAEPAWSADGRRIAFVRDGASIWVAGADGAGATRIGSGSHPAWSPDGTRIAYADGLQIGVMGSDGSDPHPITAASAEQPFATSFDPAWSPDGTRIAFSRGTNAPLSDVLSVAPDGSDERFVASVFDMNVQPDWAPDGSAVAIVSSGGHHAGSYVSAVPGSQLSPDVLIGIPEAPPFFVTSTWPAWSPDGLQVAYAGDEFDLGAPPSIVAVTLATGDRRVLVADGSQPDWQPLVAAPPACADAVAGPASLRPTLRFQTVRVTVAGADVTIGRVRPGAPLARRTSRADTVRLLGVPGLRYRLAFRAVSDAGSCAGTITVRASRR